MNQQATKGEFLFFKDLNKVLLAQDQKKWVIYDFDFFRMISIRCYKVKTPVLLFS